MKLSIFLNGAICEGIIETPIRKNVVVCQPNRSKMRKTKQLRESVELNFVTQM